MVKFSFYIFAFLSLCAMSFASTVVEDSRSRFVLDDGVSDTAIYGCTDEMGEEIPGNRFAPENSTVDGNGGVPFRIYRVAVPAGATPRVSVSVKKTKALKGDFCKGSSLNFSPVKASAPIMRDGLWMVDIRVPLYEKSGASLRLRTQFRAIEPIPFSSRTSSSGDEPINVFAPTRRKKL